MSDLMVLKAQQFINSTYNKGATLGIAAVPENGNTSWTVMYALTRALQHELGITNLSDGFGPTTLSTLQTKFPVINASTKTPENILKIIQSGLYCKGYDGGKIDGTYNPTVQASVTQLKKDMGVSSALPGSGIEPKVFKGLLNMDPYVLISGGNPSIRQIQQWLNGRYVKRRDFQIIPAEGYHSRTVAQCMLFAIQYEAGMADGVANGVFGPGTQSSLKNHVLQVGSTGIWAQLFTAAMILNKRSVAFGSFTAEVSTAVTAFQTFAKLPTTGKADFATWSSLLVSYGDQSRAGSACDGVTKITDARAKALYAAGYRYVGRYLYNPSTKNLLEKQIQPGELATIASNGLRCFPIYQTFNNSVDYFTPAQGAQDAEDATFWAKKFGFKDGTIIYFSVDYDALDGEVTSNVLPYFRALNNALLSSSGYKVGIYGARNVCQRVFDEGLSSTSFVCDMSSGFSGNLGYPLPTNWAFDQIDTVSVGTGDSLIEIDKNISSGRDIGQNTYNQTSVSSKLDVFFNEKLYKDALLKDLQKYLVSIGVPETGGDGWTDRDWATLGGVTTTMAFNRILSKDILITNLARELGIRKALIQAPVLWESRKWNPTDIAADDAVIVGAKSESSTGWGQIFASSAISGWNYCVSKKIINGNLFDPVKDLRTVWFKLKDDIDFNIKCTAYLHFWDANDIGVPRPSLSMKPADIQALIGRYNGVGPKAEVYSKEVKGVYDVLENYNTLCRG